MSSRCCVEQVTGKGTHLGLVGHQTLSNGIDLLSPGRSVRLLPMFVHTSLSVSCHVVSCLVPIFPLILILILLARTAPAPASYQTKTKPPMRQPELLHQPLARSILVASIRWHGASRASSLSSPSTSRTDLSDPIWTCRRDSRKKGTGTDR